MNSYLSLKKEHQDMYQVQTQLCVGGTDYVDFVIWTNEEMHTERIQSDPDKWNETCVKSKQVLQKAVLLKVVSPLSLLPLAVHHHNHIHTSS